METVAIAANMSDEQNRRISEAVEREEAKLRGFIRRRVADRGDVEDVLQDVFFELVEAYRLTQPIDQVGAWLFRVARNKITDRFRRKRPDSLDAPPPGDEGEGAPSLADLLPSPDAGPEAAYARSVLLDELADALEELPEEQRTVFLAHEVDGRSFRELASATGVSINTLLSRKRYAVLYLRRRLEAIYDDYRKG